MKLFPIFAHLRGRRVVVVGAGAVAERKVLSLLSAGADVVAGAPVATLALKQLAEDGRIRLHMTPFDPVWLDDAWFVVAATDDRSLNRHIAELAEARRLLINVVDDPELSSFQVPSIVDRSPITIAISSAGNAPVIARRVRERIESLFDHTLGSLTALAAQYRPAIRAAKPDLRRRREFYDWLLDGPVAGALRAGRPATAASLLESSLQAPQLPPRGHVVLVGAGPGDPGLLTLNALRALNEADIILYDRLVSAEILDLARRDAERISVGKLPGENHDATQTRIHELMRHHASMGQRVLRLKGGDAFVFGRGGEELEFLKAHDISFEVVPGITAALACAAYAGIPLTHRQHAQSIRLITAHCRDDTMLEDWPALAQGKQTLAFYMGVGQLEFLSTQLIAHGKAADTPFAIVENGSRPDQRVLYGRLDEMAQAARHHVIKSPSILLIGDVCKLAPKLGWFGASLPASEASASGDMAH